VFPPVVISMSKSEMIFVDNQPLLAREPVLVKARNDNMGGIHHFILESLTVAPTESCRILHATDRMVWVHPILEYIRSPTPVKTLLVAIKRANRCFAKRSCASISSIKQ
jgi:hypothetical protein